MIDTVLVPVDDSEPAMAALEFTLEQFPGAHLIVYHAINPIVVASEADTELSRRDFWPAQIEQAEAEAEELLDRARQRAEDHTAAVELDSEVGPAAENVVRYVDEHDVDHVVIGSHGRTGLSRIALGSVAETVIRRVSVPVTVIHDDESV